MMLRRLKCSAMRPSGTDSRPCRSALARSSVCNNTWKCFADEGTYETTSSSNVVMPTRSRWRCDRYARHAATYEPYSSLLTPWLANAIDFDTSSSTAKLAFVSASYCLTKYLSVRAYTFQSTRRMSSPGTYPRCSAKSIDAPKYGARCNPLMKPSTTVFASSSRLRIRPRTFGSIKRAPGVVDMVSWRLSGLSGGQTRLTPAGSDPYIPDFG